MFGDLVSSIGDKADALRTKLILYIIVGIIVIVIVSVLLEGVRKVIRGLDTAALGALFFWLATKLDNVPVVAELARYLYAAGATLFIVGILVFIITKLFGRRRRRRKDEE